MITLRNNNRSFILFKTHLKEIGENYTIKLKKDIPKKEVTPAFEVVTDLNYHIITILDNIDKLSKECTLYIYNDLNECIYKESVQIIK